MLAVGLGLGCSTTPKTVYLTQPTDAKFIRAESPIDWSSRRTACSDARKRARTAARQQCTVAEVTVSGDSCECRRGESSAASWRCSAEAAYTCVDDEGAPPVASTGL